MTRVSAHFLRLGSLPVLDLIPYYCFSSCDCVESDVFGHMLEAEEQRL